MSRLDNFTMYVKDRQAAATLVLMKGMDFSWIMFVDDVLSIHA